MIEIHAPEPCLFIIFVFYWMIIQGRRNEIELNAWRNSDLGAHFKWASLNLPIKNKWFCLCSCRKFNTDRRIQHILRLKKWNFFKMLRKLNVMLSTLITWKVEEQSASNEIEKNKQPIIRRNLLIFYPAKPITSIQYLFFFFSFCKRATQHIERLHLTLIFQTVWIFKLWIKKQWTKVLRIIFIIRFSHNFEASLAEMITFLLFPNE